MKFELNKAIEILRQTPYTLARMLEDLSPEWTESKGAREHWSPYDVIGHLIHGEETDWIPRAEIILAQGENKTFDPYDRLAQFEKSKSKTLADLLSEFAHLRNTNLEMLGRWQLTTEQLALKGLSSKTRRGHSRKFVGNMGCPRSEPHPTDRGAHGRALRKECRAMERIPLDS